MFLMLWAAEWATVLFVVFVSLGEAIWSPRWYDYSMSVAPEVSSSHQQCCLMRLDVTG